jgi:ABC-type thiamine transport system substrate-binding protein
MDDLTEFLEQQKLHPSEVHKLTDAQKERLFRAFARFQLHKRFQESSSRIAELLKTT